MHIQTKKIFNALFFSCLLPFSSISLGGPFGLEMGMTLKDLGNPEELKNSYYRLLNVPKPHAAFESYIIKVTKKQGLCWIKAVGKNIKTNVYGSELKSEFNEMQSKLESIYGSQKTTDTLLDGSIWNEPREFMRGMVKKERFLISIWDKSTKAKLSYELLRVGLMAQAINTETGYLIVEYSFINEPLCDNEASAEDSSL